MNEFICSLDDDMGNYIVLSHSLAPKIGEGEKGVNDEIWRMHFDGAHSQHGIGVGIVFTSLLGDTMNFSCMLEFEATHNVAEYEALFLGLELATEMEIKDFMSDRRF
jgi:hypothetical protein